MLIIVGSDRVFSVFGYGNYRNVLQTKLPWLDEVLAIHAPVISAFGGSPGVGDRGLLESAHYRAQSGYYESRIRDASCKDTPPVSHCANSNISAAVSV